MLVKKLDVANDHTPLRVARLAHGLDREFSCHRIAHEDWLTEKQAVDAEKGDAGTLEDQGPADQAQSDGDGEHAVDESLSVDGLDRKSVV